MKVQSWAGFFCLFVGFLVVLPLTAWMYFFSWRLGGRFQSFCLPGLLQQRSLFVDWFYSYNLHSFHKFKSPSSFLFISHRSKPALLLHAGCHSSVQTQQRFWCVIGCGELCVFFFSEEVISFYIKKNSYMFNCPLIIKDYCMKSLETSQSLYFVWWTTTVQ